MSTEIETEEEEYIPDFTNPAGWLTKEQKATILKEVRKMTAAEFRKETWLGIAQMTKNMNWLMLQNMESQAQSQEALRQVEAQTELWNIILGKDKDNEH